MLHKRIQSFPAETLCQFLGSDWLITELEFVKNSLQRQRHRFRRIVRFGRHFVHRFPQLIGEVQRLEQGVHVACRSLIFQTNVTWKKYYICLNNTRPVFKRGNRHLPVCFLLSHETPWGASATTCTSSVIESSLMYPFSGSNTSFQAMKWENPQSFSCKHKLASYSTVFITLNALLTLE